MGGREKGAPAPEQGQPRRGAIAGGMEVAGVSGTGARGHGFPNRGHQEVARVHATSAMPRRRPEERSEAAVAMAGEQELPGHTRNGHTSHQMPR